MAAGFRFVKYDKLPKSMEVYSWENLHDDSMGRVKVDDG
jgi:hypothetical protein